MNIILTDECVGAHSPFSKCIYNTVEFSIKNGMYSTQFFMGNPKTCKRQVIQKDDIDKTLSIIDRFDMNIFTHFPYIANLCGKVDNAAWNGNSDIDSTLLNVMRELEYEMSVIANFNKGNNRSGVVIHPGCFKNREIGLSLISETINRLKFSNGSMLILENSAGEGNKLCKNFKEIKSVLEKIDKNKLEHIGICVDTAHIWGCGEYDISNISGIKRMFDDFDSIIGKDMLYLVHLNDSKVEFGSRKDRHELLGEGNIWKNNNESLRYLISEIKKRKIPIIMETDVSDMVKM